MSRQRPFTVAEAARFLELKPAMVRRHLEQGRLRGRKRQLPGGQDAWGIWARDLQRFLDQPRRGPGGSRPRKPSGAS